MLSYQCFPVHILLLELFNQLGHLLIDHLFGITQLLLLLIFFVLQMNDYLFGSLDLLENLLFFLFQLSNLLISLG